MEYDLAARESSLGSTAPAAVVLASGILCGTTGTAVGWLVPDAPAVSVGATRLIVGGLTLSVVARFRGHRLQEFAGHARWLSCGAVAVALYQLCFFTGTTRTGVALATVLALGSAPMFSGLLQWALKGRRPTALWAACTLLACLGVGFIATGQPSSRTDLFGVAVALVAGLGWAVYAMIGQNLIVSGLESTTCMAGMFAGAALLSTPLVLVNDTSWLASGSGLGVSLYLGVVTVGVVYSGIGWGLRRLAAPVVLTLTLAEPMTAAVAAAVVLHQHPGVLGSVGVATVLVALLIVSSRNV